jgi:Mrp family chromosome partitioning ATPase
MSPTPPALPPRPAPSSIDLGASLRLHYKLSIVVALLILITGLPLAWTLGRPKYTTTAVIFVSPRFLANLEGGKEQDLQSNNQYREYVQQNVRTINRFDILMDALKRTGGQRSFRVRPKESLEHAAERLQGDLSVEAVPDTYQIAVSLEDTQKEGLAELVNAITDVYLERVKTEEFFASDDRIKTLTQDRGRLQQEIEEKQARRVAIAQELGIAGFGDNLGNPFDRQLEVTKEALSQARSARIQADAALAAVDGKQRPEGADALRAYAADLASKDPTLTSLLSHLSLRRAQVLASTIGLGPDHPGRRAAERDLADIDRQRQEAQDKLIQSFTDMLAEQRRAEAYKSTRVEQRLSAELARQTSQASWFAKNFQEGMQLGLEIERSRKRLDTIQERIDFLSLEKNAPGFVRLFTAARVPGQPSKGGRKKYGGMCLVLALLAAIALPLAVDLADPRVHSPRQVEATLGFGPISWLMEKRDAGTDFSREQTLRLANRLSQERQNNGSRIFAFTSVKAKGGTSTIVTETAQALARLGMPSLAVEANAYRADPRYRKPGARGLAVLLTGHHPLEEVIVPGDDDMPARIPVGEIGTERNLPDIQRLVEILRDAAAAYEVVLIDLPPILVSVDAEYIARAADVAVLVIEAESVTRAELRRAALSLERLRVSAVSAVLNRVRGAAAGGFARTALREFQTGSTPTGSKWLRPWLWV